MLSELAGLPKPSEIVGTSARQASSGGWKRTWLLPESSATFQRNSRNRSVSR
jgi:hypothetical protein